MGAEFTHHRGNTKNGRHKKHTHNCTLRLYTENVCMLKIELRLWGANYQTSSLDHPSGFLHVISPQMSCLLCRSRVVPGGYTSNPPVKQQKNVTVPPLNLFMTFLSHVIFLNNSIPVVCFLF